MGKFPVAGIAILLLSLIPTLPVFGRGQIEERISRARELIAQNNLNEAELLLVEIEREDPERQDEVEEMRNLIRAARRGYNQLYSRLIDVLRSGANEDEAVEIIRQLESLDSNPNPTTARLVFEAKRTVLFKQSQRRLNDLMERGLALLDRGEFLAALELYSRGTEIHREIFLNESYDGLVRSSVLRLITQVENAIQLATSQPSPFTNLGEVSQRLAANPEAPLAEWNRVIQALLNWMEWFRDTESALAGLRQQDELIARASASGRGDAYLAFMNALISGRDFQGRREGILGAFFRYFRENVTATSAALEREALRRLTEARDLMESQQLVPAQERFRQAQALARSGIRFLSVWNTYLTVSGSLRPEAEQTLVDTWRSLELLRYVDQLAEGSMELARLRTEVDQWTSTPPTQLDELTRVARQSRAFGNRAEELLSLFEALARRQTEMRNVNLTPPASDAPVFQALWRTQLAYFRRSEADFYNRRAELVYPDLEREVQRIEATMASANRLIEGERRRDEVGLEYLSRSPRQALQILQQAQQSLPPLRENVATFIQDYAVLVDQIRDERRIQEWVQRGQGLLSRLEALQTDIQASLPRLTAQVNEAQSLLLRSREALTLAESNLAQQRFSPAREALGNAQSLWEASFLIQDEPDLRLELEQRRVALMAAIREGERQQVAREVRTLIQQGSQAYLQSRFTQAEELLLRARDRWADTESEPNVEVELWLGLTRNALTFSAGRELNKTDPLYFEIQPLLNFALQDYETARQLWDTDRSRAQALLQQASQRIEQVRIPFPLNQTAGILQLRILQLTASPQEFQETFRARVQRARELSRVNPTQALADLQDLAAIQSTPEIQTLIRQLRITVGLDPPPPNPADLARSRQLTAQAERIVNANQFNRFGEARTLVEEALRLDPTNAEAQRLLDRIIVTGPRTGTVAALTPQERASLDQAAQLFNQGRLFEARAIVDRLLAEPKNRTNPEILKLQTSINARLRI